MLIKSIVSLKYRFYSTDNNTTLSCFTFVPVISYSNADVKKTDILQDNKAKVGIYRWVNLITGKSYVGSSGNLSDRFRQYFNINFLEREVVRNNSYIYKSLIKNGYSNFKLEILEYCELDVILIREQYYIDLFNPEYNILKIAGSFRGFKHSTDTKRIMSLKKKDNIISDEIRLKIATTLSKGVNIIVKNYVTDEIWSFISIRKAAEFIGIHHSYLAKTLNLKEFYSNSEFLVYRSSTPLDTIEKITLNSNNVKPVLVTNIETKETLEFLSTSDAANYLGVSESYVRRCITNNKACNGHSIVKK